MAQPTVRNAAIEVFRARGLTRMFANPGSTEVPLLIDLPADFEFVLGLHEGIGRRDGDRVGARPGRACARPPPHDRRPRERRRRAGHRARQPRAARRARRPAGPAAPRPRALPRRAPRGSRGHVPGLGRAADQAAGALRRDRPRVARGNDPAGPGARRRADGRLARSRRRTRTTSLRPPAPSCAPRGGSGRGRRPRGAARRRRASRARRRRRGGRAAGLGGARRARGAARRASLAGVVRRAGRVPAGPPAFRRSPAVRPGQAARRPRAIRRCPRGRGAGVPAVRLRPRAVLRARAPGSR